MVKVKADNQRSLSLTWLPSTARKGCIRSHERLAKGLSEIFDIQFDPGWNDILPALRQTAGTFS